MAEFTLSTKVIYGKDVHRKLNELKQERIWVVCDRFLVQTPIFLKIKTVLEKSNAMEIFDDIVPDPPLEKITHGVVQLWQFKPTIILAIGGGSAIDTAKAVRYVAERKNYQKIKSFIAIPTTSGTGSEVTSVSVITDTEAKKKYPIVDKGLIPDIALLVPEFVASCPKSVTAYSGMDVLTHACEALIAKDANVFTDAFAEKAIEYVFKYLPTCYGNGEVMEAREKMHEASCLAGLAFEKAGLGVCHAISHQIGGQFHFPHGLINAILLPKVVAVNAEETEAAKKYANIAKKLAMVQQTADQATAVKGFIQKIEYLARELSCETKLSSLSFNQEEYMRAIPAIIKHAKEDFTYAGNPKSLTNEELAAICISII
ncbi:hypothetical protein CHH55_09885 [Niallia circulans]|jgi:1-propanol dehydrogenase|uniref:1-propanol dehydrogenase PduQ n=1 Tax=Niallia circulans TaxID=1397 RepID=UPI000BA77968|nr:1-propanol dehydrogenase PduQ [Niallia circulans]PAD88062.1 hypothetical protein CHH55_09885 [Niallia circulans]